MMIIKREEIRAVLKESEAEEDIRFQITYVYSYFTDVVVNYRHIAYV